MLLSSRWRHRWDHRWHHRGLSSRWLHREPVVPPHPLLSPVASQGSPAHYYWLKQNQIRYDWSSSLILLNLTWFWGSVNPWDWNPLWGGADLFKSSLKDPDDQLSGWLWCLMIQDDSDKLEGEPTWKHWILKIRSQKYFVSVIPFVLITTSMYQKLYFDKNLWEGISPYCFVDVVVHNGEIKIMTIGLQLSFISSGFRHFLVWKFSMDDFKRKGKFYFNLWKEKNLLWWKRLDKFILQFKFKAQVSKCFCDDVGQIWCGGQCITMVW